MPELPEVESVCRGLQSVCRSQRVTDVYFRRCDLRVPVPSKIQFQFKGSTILDVKRRAKYLLLETSRFFVINHLGMSGSWRMAEEGEGLKTHDHCVVSLKNGAQLVFNDPRRFGFFDWAPLGWPVQSPWLNHLGIEPLSPELNGAWLRDRAKGRRGPVKNFLMDQKIVVGVGNIYVSEALFYAGVRPRRGVHRVTLQEWQSVAGSLKKVLASAIAAGGTTLRDHRGDLRGHAGEFRSQLHVYGRAGESCHLCKSPIQKKVLSARSTYWCSHCQR